MSKLDPFGAEALVALSNELGLRIFKGNIFDPLKALQTSKSLDVEHKATRTLVASNLRARSDLYYFLQGWKGGEVFALHDADELKELDEATIA